MSCNSTFSIKEWRRGDYFKPFSLTFKRESVDFNITDAGIVAKKDTTTIEFLTSTTPEKPNVVTFSLPNSANSIPAGRYRFFIYIYDSGKKDTLAEGSWVVK